MTIQYVIPIKVIDSSKDLIIQNSLRSYESFTDGRGNLKSGCFSHEKVDYVGEIVVVRILEKDVALMTRTALSRIEGLVVLPITESDWEEDVLRTAELREVAGIRG